MKWWRILVSLFSIETMGLLIYNLNTGSHPDESILFGLSPTRLFIVIVLGLLILFSFLILWHLIKDPLFQNKFLKVISKQHFIQLVIIANIGVFALDLYLISQNPARFRDYQQLYLNFKPFLVWGYVVCIQTLMFSAVWFFHQRIDRKSEDGQTRNSDELLILLGIFLAAVLIKILLVIPSAYGPVIRGDELRYYEMANYLYAGNFDIGHFNHSPFLYPLMLSIAFAFKNNPYETIKVLNVLFSSSIIFPIFLIARKYLSKKDTFRITILSCVLPYHLLFPRVIMSENLYFPLLLWAILFLLQTTGKLDFNWLWVFLTGINIGLLYLTRYVTLSIIPLLLCAWWLIQPGKKNVFSPDKRKIAGMFLLVGGIFTGYCPWLIPGYKAGVPIRSLLGFGITSETNASQLTIANLAIWLSLYLNYFILMAAPVLPIITRWFSIKIKKWPVEIKNWFILLSALLLGFTTACVRHSWRALYNGDIPARIMGRYILYFAPLFIITAFLLLDQKDTYKHIPLKRNISLTILIPCILVIFSYVYLFKNQFNLHDGNLINILGSMDAAYIQYLGVFFFLILGVIYFGYSYFTHKGKISVVKTILFSGVLIFYLAGTPVYYQDLLSYQNYQYLGSQIIKMFQSGDHDISDSIHLYTPESASEWDRALMFNTFHFYDNEDLYVQNIENYSSNKSLEDDGVQNIIIFDLDDPDIPDTYEGEIIEFGDAKYLIVF